MDSKFAKLDLRSKEEIQNYLEQEQHRQVVLKEINRKCGKQKRNKNTTMYLLHKTKLERDNHFLHQQFYVTVSEHTSLSLVFESRNLECVTKNIFLISQPKHMLWVLKRTV